MFTVNLFGLVNASCFNSNLRQFTMYVTKIICMYNKIQDVMLYIQEINLFFNIQQVVKFSWFVFKILSWGNHSANTEEFASMFTIQQTLNLKKKSARVFSRRGISEFHWYWREMNFPLRSYILNCFAFTVVAICTCYILGLLSPLVTMGWHGNSLNFLEASILISS